MSHRGTLELNADGSHDSGSPGAWILHHTYDALGRLIRVQRPIPGGGSIYTEHYHYDGVRRIHEVHNNPVFPANDQEGSMDEETAPSTINATWVDREYIHTPGYVDEYVCETDRNDVPLYHMQDANFNVVGIVNAAGGMLRQYTLDPYGRVIRTEQFLDHVPSRLGHQGLFFDRLDAGITVGGLLPAHMGVTEGSGSNTDTPWLGAYQNRNRTYLPQHRRFAQRDPNGTATSVSGLSLHGFVPAIDGLQPSSSGSMANGMHHHSYLGSSTVRRLDPTGLDFNFTSLMQSSMISGGLNGALTGTMSHFSGQGFSSGFAAGFVGGLLGGAAGSLTSSAFGASASGLFSTLAIRGAAGGVAGGAVGGFSQGMVLHRGDVQRSLGDALFGAMLGGVFGGIGGSLADDLRLTGMIGTSSSMASSAVFPAGKITRYLLDPSHPGGKDGIFRGYFGCSDDTAAMLEAQLRSSLDDGMAFHTRSSQYGEHYNAFVNLIGPNGRQGVVVTTWIQKNGESHLSFVGSHWAH